jgi:hypothetical protein
MKHLKDAAIYKALQLVQKLFRRMQKIIKKLARLKKKHYLCSAIATTTIA